MNNRNTFQSLNGVLAVTPGLDMDASRYRYFTLLVAASLVTTGANLQVQTLSPSGNWVKVQDVPIAANGESMVVITGNAHDRLRVAITSRTDGTYSAWIVAGNAG